MRFLGFASLVPVFLIALAVPSLASAAGETADANSSITPRTATFFTNAFSPANWSSEVVISPAGPPPAATMQPIKVADLGFPPSSEFTFNPSPSMPVCPDSELGPPPTANSIPVPDMIARCPDSLIGNGTATFNLGQLVAVPLAGETLVFNGGRVDGLPRVKVYSYSYDTQVGIYTEALLRRNGHLVFEIPRLTADSSVTALSMDIPGERIVVEKPDLNLTVTLPPGQDPNYARARCVGGGFPWTADFTMGSRDANGDPTGPPEFTIGDSGVNPCTGVVGRAKFGRLQVSGPSRVARNRSTTYRVRVKNTGVIAATGAQVRVSGRGVAVNVAIGKVEPGATRTIGVKLRPKVAGRIKAAFQVSAAGAGSGRTTRTITVMR